VAADPFAFAEVNARTVAAGRNAREELTRRLDVTTEDDVKKLRASPSWELILTYCIEGPLNIDWYDAKIAAWKLRQHAFLTASLVVTVGVVGLLVWRQASDSTIAQLSAAVAALIACVRILAGASDVKAQLGGFWRARADLKEQFLTFEQAWRGKILVAGVVAEGLEMALWSEIVNARHVVRGERDTYFATFAAPADALSSATGGLDAVFGRARELNVVQVARVAPVAEARRQLDLAKAERAAQTTMQALLATQPATMSHDDWQRARAEAAAGHAKAEAEVARYTDLLRSTAKAATLNPSS
jgi:hypothetical protein